VYLYLTYQDFSISRPSVLSRAWRVSPPQHTSCPRVTSGPALIAIVAFLVGYDDRTQRQVTRKTLWSTPASRATGGNRTADRRVAPSCQLSGRIKLLYNLKSREFGLNRWMCLFHLDMWSACYFHSFPLGLLLFPLLFPLLSISRTHGSWNMRNDSYVILTKNRSLCEISHVPMAPSVSFSRTLSLSLSLSFIMSLCLSISASPLSKSAIGWI